MERCERCGRTTSVDDENYIYWEATEAGGAVCPDCLTSEEVQAMDEDMMDLADTTPLGDPTDPRYDD